MRRRGHCRSWAAAAVAAGLSILPICGGSPDYASVGDLRDLMLIYCGDGRWSAEDFRPYVTYLPGPNGERPQDWFYDSFLFLQYGGSPSGELYINGKTNKTDWEYFRQLIFDPNSHLYGLDKAIGQAAGSLGQPPRRVPVVVMIPYPHPGQTDFGDVDGDGISENLSDREERLKVIRWHVAAVVDGFADADFENLALYGFYWMIEWIPPSDTDGIVRETARVVHERGLKFVWIPAYFAPAAARSTDLGFDISFLQPNYAFMKQQGRNPDPQRLCCAAQVAAENGLGIEVELHPSITADPAARRNLVDYLSHGAPDRDGYMRGAPHAYYQGYLTIKELHDSLLSANRRLYDALYAFARGTYPVGALPNLAAGRPCRFVSEPDGVWPGEAAVALTDGRRREVASGAVEGVRWRGKAMVDIDLAGRRPVAGVRVGYQTPDGDSQAPVWIAVHTSLAAEGKAWEPVAAADCPQWEPAPDDERFAAGVVRLTFRRREARRLRVEVWPRRGASVCLDEVEVLPAYSLAWGRECAPDRQGLNPEVLTDGIYASPLEPGAAVRLPPGRTEMSLDLGVTSYLGSAALHLAGQQGGKPLSVTVQTAQTAGGNWTAPATRLPGHNGDTGEWLRVKLAPRDAQMIRIRVDAHDGGTWIDEVEALPPANLALHRPYGVQPGWTAKYPDDGKKLTDGVRAERDFSDGRSVGWYNADTTVTLNLGAQHTTQAVLLGVEGGGYAAVFLPSQIAALTSQDGAAWEVAGDLLPDIPETGSEVLLETLRIPCASRSARYVKLHLRAHGWLMIDEIGVLSEGRNVARGCLYSLSPPPDAADKYADVTGGVLTDGVWGSTTFGEGQTAGWPNVKPVVEIDLGEQVEARKLRAFVVGGGRAGVWFPQSVSAFSSSDGKDWREAGSAVGHPPEPGDQTIGAFMAVPLSGPPLRFLRVEFEPHGWVMVGEIEVYEE